MRQGELFEHLAKAGVLRKSKIIQPEKMRLAADAEGSVSTPLKGVAPLTSYRINPQSRLYRANNTIEPIRRLDYKTLRRVAEKAWLINTIIGHQINKIRPFLSVSANDNDRGFKVALVDGSRRPSSQEKADIQNLERWLLRTGYPDPSREDTLVGFATKFIRDLYTLDQVATEIQPRLDGKPFAFWAIDPATIVRAAEGGYEGDQDIKWVQEVNGIIEAVYTADRMVFDYQNARSDIENFGYGYSKVEQAIELILTFINSFAYNAGAFTDDRLPRGMLLLQGDADTPEIEQMEDYIVSLMQGGPTSKWRIPIIPSGADGNERKIEWVSFQNSNRDMEYSQWTEAVWTATAALFDTDLEELGIRTQKSTSVLGDNVAGKIELSKSRGLMANMSFFKAHIDKILARIDDRYCLKWCGLEPQDIKAKNDARESELRTFKSIDQIRAEDDEKPYNQDWSKIPLNPYVIQLYQAAKQAEMQQQQQAMGGSMGQDQGQQQAWPDDYRKMMMGQSDDDDEEQEDQDYQDDDRQEDQDQGQQKPRGSLWDSFKKSRDNNTVEIII